MSEIPKTYEPQAIEEKWYAFWQQEGCFTANPASPKPAYSIVIPPPNVTGILTLGHVLNNTIQDILARRARMLGREVLWLPGTDHAGIATQNVVEKNLRKAGEMKHRDELGREKLVEKIWEWKEKYGGIIIQQLKKLGASCDWSRERFTMDAAYSKCVQSVFVDLYRKGLIYRGKRMVNWCPASLTALSDEEVVMKPQNATMYYFKVEVVDADPVGQHPGAGETTRLGTFTDIRSTGTWLTIATTRPEVIPGDTAVAVNPKDARYAHLIGKYAVRPLPLDMPREERLLKIIGDDHVDFEFGTGVLKVTPAHDKADFEIAQRHGLPVIDVLHPNGVLNDLGGAGLAGLDRFAARKAAAEQLREAGSLEKEEPYQNNLGYSERADVPIESRLSEQWFLNYPSQQASREVVASGTMKFFPERWAKVYDHWMGNLQDWCISRQLWWGHRIPVWRRLAPTGDPTQDVHVDVQPPADPENWQQDSDVLDTWFSSWLWPFATMGWPAKTETLAKFYPTTSLVTGPDIIFFWVARMIMAGYEWMGDLPFKNVYFTGIIRDKQGRKLSKSLNNSPDPLELIANYGADALRFGVMRSAPLGQDVTYDEKSVELGRNFCTKLWNAARFRQMQGGQMEGEITPALLSSDDKWILLRLDAAIRTVSTALDEYRFSDAAGALYHFFWSEYCDWYLEASKASLQGTDEARKASTLAVIDFVLAHVLRLFHPFMPFVTEELWHGMGFSSDLPADQGGRTIMFAHWPEPFDHDFLEHYGLTPADEQAAQAKYEVVNQGRNLRRDFNIASNKRVRFILKPNAALPAHEAQVLKILLNADPFEVDAAFQSAKGTPTALTPLGELFLPLEGLIDVAAEKERISKEVLKVEQELAKVAAKLGNETFVSGAPAHVVEEHRKRQTDWQDRLAQLHRMLAALGQA